MKRTVTAIFFLTIFCIVMLVHTSTAQIFPPDDPLILKRGIVEHSGLSKVTEPSTTAQAPRGYAKFTAKDWRRLIDSVWGPGLPTETKLQFFDAFWNNVNSRYGGFPNLGLNWDSLKSVYRPEIEQGVSRGRFAGIMSHLYLSLREVHTWIFDRGIDSAMSTGGKYRPRGVPMLGLSGIIWTGFGAALTPLPDSSLLVIQAHATHPLGLKAGDIVVGYDRVPWKQLIRQLLDAQIPIGPPGSYSYWGGSSESWTHNLLTTAAYAWHLFDTLDVVKYPSCDTVHLSTSKLDDTSWDNFFAFERLPVKGVPAPVPGGSSCTGGVVDGTNVGYIYVGSCSSAAATRVATLLDSLKRIVKVDGLILDFRFNSGGVLNILTSLGALFNADPFPWYSIANRTSTTDKMGFTIAASGSTLAPKDQLFDHPIAVLTGPVCWSAGDYSVFFMRSHPMVRFFGKASNTAYVSGSYLSGNYLGGLWQYQISRGGVYSNYPGEGHLLHKGFDVDEKVWFAKDDVAKGDDTIVKSALGWIAGLAYGHDVALSSVAAKPGRDTVKITATVENPQKHALKIWSYVTDKGGVLVDSCKMFDDGLHSDGAAGDKVFGGAIRTPSKETMFGVSLRTTDVAAGTFRHLASAKRFWTSGPIVSKGWTSAMADTIPNPGDILRLRFRVGNSGKSDTVKKVYVSINTLDTLLYIGAAGGINYGDLLPGQESDGSTTLTVKFQPTCPPNTKARLLLSISTEGFPVWTDTVSILVQASVTDVADNNTVPTEYSVSQNYPNPFNPTTNFELRIANLGLVTLKVYDALGRDVATLVNETRAPGIYRLRWDAGNLPSGVYFYRLTAGDFSASKKLILLR